MNGKWGRGEGRLAFRDRSGRGETERVRERQKDRQRSRKSERKEETGDAQGLPFKRELRGSAQEARLVAAAEGGSYQDPKGWPAQMPEY